MLSNRAPAVFASPEIERLELLEEGNVSAEDRDDKRDEEIGPMAKEDCAEVAAEPVFRGIS
jgi:hypothetical protein